MSSLAKLILLLMLVAMVAGLSSWATSRLILKPVAVPPNDFHRWLHTQLGITGDQDKALDQEEKRFATQRKDLIDEIQKDNSALATAITQDRAYSPRVMAAVETVHHGQGMLEEATLRHIFAMKPILTSAQFDKLLQLTGETLNTPADL